MQHTVGREGKSLQKRFSKLLFGIFLYALGIKLTIQANIGYSPWEVLHVGIARRVGISVGSASIGTGLAIMTISVLLGEKIGFGTIISICLVGLLLDAITWFDLIPLSESMPMGIAMLLLGLFIISFGVFFYMSSGFGAGPRDSLMVALARKTKRSIGVCRGAIELLAVLLGWMLGGMVGIGTVLSIFTLGVFIQLSFRLFRYDATLTQHETLAETIRTLRNR